MPAISLHHVTKAYRYSPQFELRRFLQWLSEEFGGRGSAPRALRLQYALRDITLDIARGESVGIVGHNGAGKTTLLRILAGVTLPTRGRVRVEGRVSSLIALGSGFHGDLTGRENLLLYCALMGLDPGESHARLEEIVRFAELGQHIDVAFKRYSAGMMARLGFAAAIHVEPGVLLLDEILAVGDQKFQLKCLTALERLIARCTVVFVSHSPEAIQRLCPRAVWLHEGAVRADGPSSAVIAAYSRWQYEPATGDGS